MRLVILIVAGGLLAGTAAHAQVINGEGTYEGSTLHDPPPEAGARETPRSDSDGTTSAIKAPAKDKRD